MSYLLIGIPSINIRGAAISTMIAYLAVAILNWFDINNTKVRINFVQITARPLLSTAVMSVATAVSFRVLEGLLSSRNLATLSAIAVAGVVYVVCLFLTGAITKEDLELIPKGEKLQRFVRK